MSEWFGKERGLLGKRLFTAFGRKIHDHLKAGIDKAANGQATSTELEHTLPEAGDRSFQLLMVPHLDENRKPNGGFMLIFEDITELTLARKALNRSRERYRTLAESGIQGVIVHRKDKPLYCNHAFARFFGYSNPEQIIGLPNINLLLTESERRKGVAKSKLFGSGHAPLIHAAKGVTKEGKALSLMVTSRVVDWESKLAIQTAVVPMKPLVEE